MVCGGAGRGSRMTRWSRMSDLRERIVLAVLDSLEDGDPVVEIGIMPSGGGVVLRWET